jgi:diguanylate cyclase (GGDEF)-like protein
MTAALLPGAYANPIYGALWCAPAVIVTFFVMSIRLATVASSALLFCVTAMVYQSGGAQLAIRLGVAVGFAIFVINLVARVIVDLQEELLSQTVTDPLTGAFNRRHMEMLLSEAHERRRRTGAPVSVIALDIDYFKRVNDTFGHRDGDQVLKRLAEEIRRCSRRLDRLFRSGGEEFVVLLPDTTGPNALRQAERLRSAVAEARLHDRTHVTISLGVAELQADETTEAWIQRADMALYAAKRGGRNRVEFAAPEPAGELAPAPVQA